MAAKRKQPPRSKTPRDPNALPVREELFVAAYIAHGNATLAATTAGFAVKTAHAKGSELLKRPRIAAAIQAAKSRITRKYKVSAERAVEEMAVIGFSDLRHYLLDGQPIDCVSLAPGAPESATRAIKRVKRKVREIPQKVSPENPLGLPIVETETEFELWNKDTELRNIGDYLKLFKENRADDSSDDEKLTTAERKERIVGIFREAAKRKGTKAKAAR